MTVANPLAGRSKKKVTRAYPDYAIERPISLPSGVQYGQQAPHDDAPSVAPRVTPMATVAPTPAVPNLVSGLQNIVANISAAPAAAPSSPGSKKGTSISSSGQLTGGSPRENMQLGEQMAAQMGWTGKEWNDLKALWARESGWQTNADNPTSTAYGIPQILTGNNSKLLAKMKGDPAFQIRLGLNYIKNRYGSPSKAWAHSQATGWY